MNKNENQVGFQKSQVPQTRQNNTLINFCQTKDETDLVSSCVALEQYQSEADYTNQLIDILAKWRWMSGINTNSQDEDDMARELVLIATFVKNNYQTLKLSEINLAIDLSLTNKLDVDVRTFNSFSPMYVSRILNAYIVYKKSILLEVKDRKQRQDYKDDLERKPTPEERMEAMKELIQYFYDEYSEKGIVDDYFNTIYNFMEKNKYLRPLDETIKESQAYGKEMATNHIQQHFLDAIPKEKPNREYVEIRYAKNYIVQKYFKTFGIQSLLSRIKLSDFDNV